jgi:hypothetical protein
LRGVCTGEIDFVLRTIESEVHRFIRLAAVDIVHEHDLDLLRHQLIPFSGVSESVSRIHCWSQSAWGIL